MSQRLLYKVSIQKIRLRHKKAENNDAVTHSKNKIDWEGIFNGFALILSSLLCWKAAVK